MSLFGDEKSESVNYSILERGFEKLLSSERSNESYYDVSPYLNKALKKRGNKVGSIEFYLKDERGDEVWEDDWLDLLNNPNGIHSGSQFWKLFQIHKDLYGEAYIWLEKEDGEVKNLHLMNPSKVKEKQDKFGRFQKISGYTYNGRDFDLDEVIHDFNPDPKNPLEPEPLINKGAKKILKTEEQINTYHSLVMERGGTANKLISIEGDKSKERAQEEKESLEGQVEESSKTGKPIYFAGDVSVEEFGVSLDELNFTDTKRNILEDVAIMTGVPASILSSYIDTKYSNAEEAKKNFLRETVLPEMKALNSFLNQKLIPEGLELKFVNPVPVDVDRKIEVYKAAKNSMTLNEQRAFLSKLDPDLSLDDEVDEDDVRNEGPNLTLSTE